MNSFRKVVEGIWRDYFCAWGAECNGRETGRVCGLYGHKTDTKIEKNCVKSVEGYQQNIR